MENFEINQLVQIPADQVSLEGELAVPPRAKGIVLFAHGSGSSRHSPRNQFVAQALQKAGIGTLLFDLLSMEEDAHYETRFDIDLLTLRLLEGTEWMEKHPEISDLNLAYFGASTGAAAALRAAAKLGHRISAVVSRGGRPDLAMEALPEVKAPTLLIVGGNDEIVIDLNRQAFEKLSSTKELEIVPGATHLFEEPGKLETVAQLAQDWFKKYL
ncbi:MAG: alpha/beta family hydrolase [bacterium]|nr:alpha/beta family hydrolase [bacterium]